MTDRLAGTKPPTASKVWFDTYLRAHGYTWHREPNLGIPKRPDRLIHRDGLSAVCEVKQFDKDPIGWMRETGQEGWFDENKPVRGAVRQAANQLRPLKGRGCRSSSYLRTRTATTLTCRASRSSTPSTATTRSS
jgi:hypothetical protein